MILLNEFQKMSNQNGQKVADLFSSTIKLAVVGSVLLASFNNNQSESNDILPPRVIFNKKAKGSHADWRTVILKDAKKMERNIDNELISINKLLDSINDLYGDGKLNAYEVIALKKVIASMSKVHKKILHAQKDFIKAYQEPKNAEYKDILEKSVKDISIYKAHIENVLNVCKGIFPAQYNYVTEIDVKEIRASAKATYQKLSAYQI